MSGCGVCRGLLLKFSKRVKKTFISYIIVPSVLSKNDIITHQKEVKKKLIKYDTSISQPGNIFKYDKIKVTYRQKLVTNNYNTHKSK